MRPIVKERILNKFDRQCVQCGSKEKLHIDHIIPLCRGGREDEDNMQVLCRTCNLKKGKGLDYSQFFKIGVSKDYILLRTDLIKMLPHLKQGEFKTIIEQMFKQNDEELSI